MAIKTLQEAQQIAALLKEQGKTGLGEERYNKGIKALRAFEERQQENAEFAQLANDVVTQDLARERGGAGNFVKAVQGIAGVLNEGGKDITQGLGELAVTAATGAAGEIAGGAVGAGATGLLGVSATDSAAIIERISDFFTVNPRSEAGKQALRGLAVPLAKLEDGVDVIASEFSYGSPLAYSAIKTTLLGGPELFGLKGAGKATSVGKLQADIKRTADKLGIRLDESNIRGDTVAAARGQRSSSRGAASGNLQQELRALDQQARQRMALKTKAAMDHRAFMQSGDFGQLAQGLTRRLTEMNYDLSKMPQVREHITKLQELAGEVTSNADVVLDAGVEVNRTSGRVKARSLNEIGSIQNQINNRLEATSAGNSNNIKALREMQRSINEFMESKFQNDMISGNADAIQAWSEATAARKAYQDNFNADRAIRVLIDKDTSIEGARRMLMGASGTQMRPQAVTMIRKMKEIFGEDSPTIRGLRDDVNFEVMLPLMEDTPNFKQFVKNYDNMIAKNPEMVGELGLDQNLMKDLRDFARTADRVHVGKSMDSVRGVAATMIARLGLGHDIAQSAVKVSLGRSILARVFGADKVTKRQILADLTEAKTGSDKLATKEGIPYAQLVVAEALTSIPDAAEEQERVFGPVGRKFSGN